MSDLLIPPLSLAPLEIDLPPAGSGFQWPTPPFAGYAPSAPQRVPEPCEVEGLNGGQMKGRLLEIDPDQQVARVQVPPARGAVPLRFDQFRRLTLTSPIAPLQTAGDDPHAHILDHRPIVDYRVALHDGTRLTGETVGHVETDAGLFLFPPTEAPGCVQRSFVPRQAYQQVEFGRRIGELLVEHEAATEADVARAAEEQQRLRAQKIGDILITQQIVAPEQLLAAIEEQARMPMVRIGQALIALGLVTPAQLKEALSQQKKDRRLPLGELLVQMQLVSREDLQTALARKMGYPLVDVAHFPVEAEALRKVPYSLAARLNMLPLLLRSGRLIVAMEDPSRRDIIDELEFAAQAKVVPALATSAELSRMLPQVYDRFGLGPAQLHIWTDADQTLDFDSDEAGKLVASLEKQSNDGRDDDEPQIEQSDNSLVRLINSMIVDAFSQRVSDIHIETQPGRERVKIRFRKDGELRPYLELPHTYRSAIIARIKIMCDLDISERRKPQDGKINFAKYSPQHKLELRVATIPTSNGLEDVVLRLLASARPLPLPQLGLSRPNLERFKSAVERPYGLVLCVGPTGSGKTTTLHSALGHINQPGRKIWTAEDPIEITQPGLRQVQVNPKIDWTFEKALRAFLRADPDVIMVGEIRDRETAQVAIEASLTGHLVMSTLHTNSAAETVTRLLDMGMDPFNFGDSLLAVLAQRLVRRMCTHCRTSTPLGGSQLEELLADHLHVFPADLRPSEDAVLADWTNRFGREGRLMHHHAGGCAECEGRGTRGRAGIHELLAVSRELRREIHNRAPAEQLLRTGLAEGMRTLRQDGIEKVLSGATTIEEVRATSNV
jgi:type II secretory ATPase GspE/PulE/Tfp pilus assembly ATPase PilB-like protein